MSMSIIIFISIIIGLTVIGKLFAFEELYNAAFTIYLIVFFAFLFSFIVPIKTEYDNTHKFKIDTLKTNEIVITNEKHNKRKILTNIQEINLFNEDSLYIASKKQYGVIQ